MSKIYKKGCYFYREPDNDGGPPKCVVNKFTCFICDLKIDKIEGLEFKDHLFIVFSRKRMQVSLIFSVAALLLSALAIVIKVVQ